ncbi:MAG: cytochrome P450 [Proteobacteria bacterium]|nr:MAG: cytochrome P450 [Pseudomonadota bacterium]
MTTPPTDLTSQSFFRDPAAAVEKLRAAGPVVEVRIPIMGRVWMTTTQEMASRVLKDSRLFSLRKDDGSVAGLRWWMPRIFRVFANNMLTADEPDHTRLRGLVDEAFRRSAVRDMEPRIRAIAGELADQLFAQGSPADLVTRYARTLPLSVICELLGLPLADRPKFIAWAGRITSVSTVLGFLRLVPTLAAMKRYVEQQLERAHKLGGEGLIAELVRVETQGARLSRDEMVAMVFLLLFAGHETTSHLISGSVFELARNPGLRDWLAQDWNRADLAVEEFLRFVSPVQFTKPRFVRADLDLGGVRLKRGDQIVAMLTAANMDPAANELPEKLDLARRPNHHIAFGTGIHFCLGHQLARLEARCALEALYTRWPKLALAVAPDEIRWRSRPGLRAIVSLPLQ